MKKIYLFFVLMISVVGNAQIIFADANFKAALLSASADNHVAKNNSGQWMVVDVNGNNEIEVAEASAVFELYVNGENIADLTGISDFNNLRDLYCQDNQLTTLSLNGLAALRILYCFSNDLADISLYGPAALQVVFCQNNHLTAINLTPCHATLRGLNCSNNLLTDLDLTGTENTLEGLSCRDNLLSTLTVLSQKINDPDMVPPYQGIEIYCENNLLQILSVAGNVSELWCNGNPAIAIDLSQLTEPLAGYNFDPDINWLNLKNGHVDIVGNFTNFLPQTFICVDEGTEANLFLNHPNFNDWNINSYCSFPPGGDYFLITGEANFDQQNNGCDLGDMPATALRLNLVEEGTNRNVIANSGDFAIPVTAGTYTVTPVLENPEYFTVYPSSATMNFPETTSPHTQNFCLDSNGTFNDVEVAVIPFGAARPGFEAVYKLIYKNKGTTPLSGTISFTYMNSVHFVSATPTVYAQGSNVLNWNFTGLQPFEQRDIELVMLINSPQQTPAVNNGDVLHYFAAGNTDITDGTPDDNSCFLHQTVVNSFDPNDKTCLEGNSIAPDFVGKYVHYMICFENTGSANAQNIVVKDLIDTDKFDIDSLIPMDGSHEFYTRTNGNKVEFIFENIQLPFDDANNDGYVMFKIKTKPTLVIGDSFSNSAQIYFDYNYPIVTDPAVTDVQFLGVRDFDFASEFTLYPNPAHAVLSIESKSKAQIHSAEIYNALGQLVLAVTNAETISKIDVSDLASGNYFLKVTSDKGNSNVKFIKY